MMRPVSLHCVKAHGSLYEKVAGDKDLNGISSIILHSYSGSLDQARLWIRHYAKCNQLLYFSLSNWINGSDNKRDSLENLVTILNDDQILLETDVGIDKYLLTSDTREEYFNHIREIFSKICSIKHWDEGLGREIIHRNWTRSVAK